MDSPPLTFGAEEKGAEMVAHQEGRLNEHQDTDEAIGNAYTFIEPANAIIGGRGRRV